MSANPMKIQAHEMNQVTLRRTLTRSQFDDVLSKMESRAVKAVERTTVLINGSIDGVPMLAAFDLMTNVGYLEACSAPAGDFPQLP